MCGIMGYRGSRPAREVVIDGLKRQEYRGYDSWGIALASPSGRFQVEKRVGRISHFDPGPLDATARLGIGHTRWATHGGVTEANSHPHFSCAGDVAVVHNGIIENHDALRARLAASGHRFRSETDTEVVAHLLEDHLKSCGPEEALRRTCQALEGTFALAILLGRPLKLAVARRASPLVIGLGDQEYFVASDLQAFLGYTKQILALDDNEMAFLDGPVEIQNYSTGQKVSRPALTLNWTAQEADRGGYPHFMLKEIHEQPEALRRTVSAEKAVEGLDLRGVDRVMLLGCGTTYHASQVGRYYFESLCRIPAEFDYAAEFRYREPILDSRTLVVAVSQSGETRDTLAAVAKAKEAGARTLAICNVPHSTLSREADQVLYTQAGPEIGVASTKAFTSQLVVEFLLALRMGLERGHLSAAKAAELRDELQRLPDRVAQALQGEEAVQHCAEAHLDRPNFLYLGRGIQYPIALEGALKLKEIAYIHAEGQPAAELKHGPIALVDSNMPSVFIACQDPTYTKILNSIAEVKARGGIIISVVTEGEERIVDMSDTVLRVPSAGEWLLPAITVIPLQLLAYHVADLKECDVDKPRNLAKSVTVE